MGRARLQAEGVAAGWEGWKQGLEDTRGKSPSVKQYKTLTEICCWRTSVWYHWGPVVGNNRIDPWPPDWCLLACWHSLGVCSGCAASAYAQPRGLFGCVDFCVNFETTSYPIRLSVFHVQGLQAVKSAWTKWPALGRWASEMLPVEIWCYPVPGVACNSQRSVRKGKVN